MSRRKLQSCFCRCEVISSVSLSFALRTVVQVVVLEY